MPKIVLSAVEVLEAEFALPLQHRVQQLQHVHNQQHCLQGGMAIIHVRPT